ncbi:hypothetical protein IPZ61_08860 [Streptomyces sioyaensis]|uniref:hypothetical protein n=1 Tax=Streptomyces sioyaensis TaxID=67364 RepID=UPI001F1C92BE|nr:hypothetical protein [Streptomyces sioyaensis]MCF3173424.1 hypothetical protein [Streptomyces sioyaensis]
MQKNNGIIANGGSNVVGSAVASGRNASVEVGDSTLNQTGGGQQHSPQEIGDLLSRLIEELGRSHHPDRADLIEAAEDARVEVSSPEPRKGTLRTFAKGLVSAVPGFTALAALAKTIEEAVRGL